MLKVKVLQACGWISRRYAEDEQFKIKREPLNLSFIINLLIIPLLILSVTLVLWYCILLLLIALLLLLLLLYYHHYYHHHYHHCNKFFLDLYFLF